MSTTEFTKEEERCIKLLARYGAEWPWYMTDEEYATARRAIERRDQKKQD